jgi:methylated-DNA-protein-cysteine methyltransferase-like protein
MDRASYFQKVYEYMGRVPEGRVVTYGQVAMALGNPRQARAVGWAMQVCPDGVPWQRVVNAHGGLSTSPRHGNLQRKLLEGEGIQFKLDGCIDLRVYGWNERDEK